MRSFIKNSLNFLQAHAVVYLPSLLMLAVSFLSDGNSPPGN